MSDLSNKEVPKDVEALVPLLELANRLGKVYGSEDISMLFYNLIRRERLRNVVELGTGLGVTTFWMAQALRELGQGRVWTIDDGSHWQDGSELPLAVEKIRGLQPFESLPESGLDYPGFIRESARALGLAERIDFVNERLDLGDEDIFTKRGYSFLQQPVDLVFADIRRGPDQILDVFFHFLPRLAESASIFIDSASTSLTSYLFLEKFVAQLNQSKMPRHFLKATQRPERRRGMIDLIGCRRFTLVHLIERQAREQNSTAWIKIEPIDYLPYPLTMMKM